MSQQSMERKINWTMIAIFAGLLANFGTIVWQASKHDSRIAQNEKDIGALRDAITGSIAERQSDRELLVRMDERTRQMAVDIAELKKRENKR